MEGEVRYGGNLQNKSYSEGQCIPTPKLSFFYFLTIITIDNLTALFSLYIIYLN